MKNTNKPEPWYIRLARRLGLDPYSRAGRQVRLTTSKHARGKSKPHDWKRKEKVRRKMSDLSRRINRGK